MGECVSIVENGDEGGCKQESRLRTVLRYPLDQSKFTPSIKKSTTRHHHARCGPHGGRGTWWSGLYCTVMSGAADHIYLMRPPLMNTDVGVRPRCRRCCPGPILQNKIAEVDWGQRHGERGMPTGLAQIDSVSASRGERYERSPCACPRECLSQRGEIFQPLLGQSQGLSGPGCLARSFRSRRSGPWRSLLLTTACCRRV